MRDATWTCFIGYGLSCAAATGLGLAAAFRGQWMATTALLFVALALTARMLQIMRVLRPGRAS